MSTLERIREFLNRNRDLAFEMIRIYLGLGLFAKGVYFAGHMEEVLVLVHEGQLVVSANIMAHYVVVAHLVGGLMLAAGLATRLAAAVQVPVLVGAVFLVHIREGLFARAQNLEFAVLVLFLLVLAALVGGGRLSWDYYLARRDDAKLEEARSEPVVGSR